MVLEILKFFHDVPEAGHGGIKSTKQRIKSRRLWTNMNKEIAQ